MILWLTVALASPPITWRPTEPVWQRIDAQGNVVVDLAGRDRLLVADGSHQWSVSMSDDANLQDPVLLGVASGVAAGLLDHNGDGVDDLWVGGRRSVSVLDGVNGAVLESGDTPEDISGWWQVAALDGDEGYFVTTSRGSIVVLDASGTLVALQPTGTEVLEIVQLDDDPALEIVTGTGVIFEGSELRIDTTGTPVGEAACSADVDQDGHDELLIGGGGVWTLWDPDLGPRWSVYLPSSPPSCALGDFDGDGELETFLPQEPQGRDSSYRILDALTGLHERVASIPEGCGPMTVLDTNGDGIDSVLCYRRNYILMHPTGEYHRHEFIGRDGEPPTVSDLDGDGNAELIWYTGVIQDPTDGRILDRVWEASQPFAAIIDWDDDGRAEIVDTSPGIHVYRWSPGSLTLIDAFTTSKSFRNPVFGPLWGPGSWGLLYGDSYYPPSGTLDLHTGFETSDSYLGAAAVLDVDGAPPMEVWSTHGFHPQLSTLTGAYITAFAEGAIVFQRAGATWFIDAIGTQLRVHRMDAALSPTLVSTIDLPAHPTSLSWQADRVWMELADASYAWSPFDDTLWKFDVQGEVAVAGGNAWFVTRDSVTAWPLP